MEPDLCPSYWPRLIWRLVHHHGPGPDPAPIDRSAFQVLDQHFATLGIAALANSVRAQDARLDIQKNALRVESNPMPGVMKALEGMARA